LSAVLSGLGLLWLSYADSLVTALAAGSLFALGVAYFWPTMIGTTSERVPKGGALALAMVGAVGMLSVGLITTPMMGRVADRHLHERLPLDATQTCLQQIVDTLPALAKQAPQQHGTDIRKAVTAAEDVLKSRGSQGSLPLGTTAEALRLAIAAVPEAKASEEAKRLLRPAENFGGQVAFRHVAVLAVALTLIFGLLHVSSRKGA
jgi:hypothetical protein